MRQDSSCRRDYRGRFAPSPTGALHFGSLVAALASYLDARANRGEWLLRIEDLDQARTVRGASDAILHALDRVGFEWTGAVAVQSQRVDLYQAALERLRLAGEVYPCSCSRRDIAARALAETLVNRSAHRYGDEHRFQVDVVEGPASDVLRWYTRDFQRIRLVTSATAASDTDALIQPLTDPLTPPANSFVGAAYTVARRWTPQGLSGVAWARWLLFNEAKTPAQDQKVVLWVNGAE